MRRLCFYAIGSISSAVKCLLPATEPNKKEERPPSPFPTIPNISQRPEIIQESKRKISVTDKEVERSSSPFSLISDINMKTDVMSEDINRFQKKESLKSCLRPESQFPLIIDVTLNPEVVEKDIIQMRTSPALFALSNSETAHRTDEVKCDVSAAENCVLDNQNFATVTVSEMKPKNDVSNSPAGAPFAFPDIPVDNKFIESNTFVFQPPLRRYEPVSLTGKKYKLREPEIGIPVVKPQYNFALANSEYKVVERTYNGGTGNNIRSLQSEIFESHGHFNASRSCSPYPIYIPSASREPTPPPKEMHNAQNMNINQATLTVDPEDMIEMPHLESNAEKRLRDSTIGGNETVSKNVKSQQKCFSELRDIQFCYAIANGDNLDVNKKCSALAEKKETQENEIQKCLKEMKNIREGKSADDAFYETTNNITTSSCSAINKAVTNVVEVNGAAPSMETKQSFTIKKDNLKNHSEVVNHSEKGLKTNEEDTEIPELLCRKPPDAIIGARPLFGQLDITSEFKKAIVGRSKSLQSKRSREESKQTEKCPSECKIKAEKLENIETEDITADSKLSTQMKDTTKAEITKLQASGHEEIEKIYFQQEREYEVDIQTSKDNFDLSSVLKSIGEPERVEYFRPHSYAVANTHDKTSREIYSCKANRISKSSRVNSNLNVCEETAYDIQKRNTNNEEDEYRKVPVKSLIQNFEQCSMPAMRYKQIRDPLPDIVDKLSSTRPQSKNNEHEMQESKKNKISCTPEKHVFMSTSSKEFNLKKAEEEFDNLFYIANTSVRTQPYFPKLEIQNFQQSENSSFCRYSSHANLSQHIPYNPANAINLATTQNFTEEATQKGKLCFIHLFDSCIQFN